MSLLNLWATVGWRSQGWLCLWLDCNLGSVHMNGLLHSVLPIIVSVMDFLVPASELCYWGIHELIKILPPYWSASFFPTWLHYVMLWSTLLITLSSACSALLTHFHSDQLWLLRSWSALLASIWTSCLDWIGLLSSAQLCLSFLRVF